MADMPRPRPPHLHPETTRHGRTVWFHRVGHGPRTRINGDYGTEAFWAAFQAAERGEAPPARAKERANSLAWLIARYRESAAWLALSAATRKQRENIFLHIIKSAGADDFRQIARAHIAAGRDRRAKTPAQARNFLDAMRGVFGWALESGFRKDNPTEGVKNPPRGKTGGFPAWTEEDVEAYERRWPVGSRQRVWLDVLLYSGLRRGDAVRYGKPHVRNGVGRIKTEKSRFQVTVTLPILPVLETTLRAGPTGDLTFICGENGKPLTKESFGNMFSEAARLAGVKKSAHGVRKIAATRAANKGASDAQLEALFGWDRGSSMAALYTKEANLERLAISAFHTFGRNEQGISIPAPDNVVRDLEGKDDEKQQLKK